MHNNGKTALVLAGGGLTGAVYEIGALRAIDDLLVDRTVNDFDIFVGTSAGALVASFLANGVSPEEMIQVLAGTNPDVPELKRKHLFSLNKLDYLSWGLKLPAKLLTSWTHYLRNVKDMTLFDLLWSITGALPSGMYDGLALERFVRETLSLMNLTNDFKELDKDLNIIATDLDTGERAVFGRGGLCDVPVSLAVAASSALPLVYKPVRIGDRDYVDGGLRGTASIDVAIECGATLILCINPLVPLDSNQESGSQESRVSYGHLSDKGIQSISNQSLRILSHAGLQYHIKQIRRTHPEVDIILIEPRPEDQEMFFYNIMRYSARLIVARHGFESATTDLAVDYPYYKQILARHGIPLSRRLVIQELNEIIESKYDPKVIRRVLEARSADCGQPRSKSPICQLNRALAELEFTLDKMEENPVQ